MILQIELITFIILTINERKVNNYYIYAVLFFPNSWFFNFSLQLIINTTSLP